MSDSFCSTSKSLSGAHSGKMLVAGCPTLALLGWDTANVDLPPLTNHENGVPHVPILGHGIERTETHHLSSRR
jgi:hypothetical protein